MTTNLLKNEVDLGAFLEQVGRSFSEAQESLGIGLDLPTSFVVANAEMEIKAAVNFDAEGRTVVQTVSAQDVREGRIDPGVLSTVRISFVATAREMLQAPPSDRPKRHPQEVIEDIRHRPDVASLERILGDLDVEATYVPERKRWLAVIRDPKGRVVREAILPDKLEEDNVD